MSLAHQLTNTRFLVDISAILEKNDAIARHGGGPGNSSALDCQAGREIYFGSSIGLRAAAHGGFLSFDGDDSIRASAASMTPLARFVLLNAENLQDSSLLRYGDAVLLQVGEYEVLGVKYRFDGSGKLVPYLAVINSRGENLKKATAFGRWIIMNQKDSIGNMGSIIGHLDSILLEKEWGFLSSSNFDDAGLTQLGSFHNMAIEPKIDCTWIIHMIPLAGIHDIIDYKHLNRGLLTSATNQLDKSAEGRQQASQMFNKISRKFYHLKSREVDVAEIRSPPRRLQKLKKIHARIAEFERPISPSPHRLSRQLHMIDGSESLESFASPLARATASYRECAAPLMRSCKDWSNMDSNLSKFLDVNPSIRINAALKIQRWFQRHVLKFSFQRALEQRRKVLEIRAQEMIGSSCATAAINVDLSIDPSSRNVEQVLVFGHPGVRGISETRRHTPLRSPSPKESTFSELKNNSSTHFSRRRPVCAFKVPVSYRDVRISSLQERKYDIKAGLKLLRTTHDKNRLFEDLHFVKLKKKEAVRPQG